MSARLIGGEMVVWSDLDGRHGAGPASAATLRPLLSTNSGDTLVAGPHSPELLASLPPSQLTLLARGLPDADLLADRFPGATVLCASLDKLAAEPAYDTVVALDGLGRLRSAEDDATGESWADNLARLVAVLRPGGRLLLGLENLFGVHRLLAPAPEPADADWSAPDEFDPTRPASPTQLRAALAAAGLTTQAEYAAFPTPGNPSALLAPPLLTDPSRRGWVTATIRSAFSPWPLIHPEPTAPDPSTDPAGAVPGSSPAELGRGMPGTSADVVPGSSAELGRAVSGSSSAVSGRPMSGLSAEPGRRVSGSSSAERGRAPVSGTSAHTVPGSAAGLGRAVSGSASAELGRAVPGSASAELGHAVFESLADPGRIVAGAVRAGIAGELAPGWFVVAQRGLGSAASFPIGILADPADISEISGDAAAVPVGTGLDELLLGASLRRDLPVLRELLVAWQSSADAGVPADRIVAGADGSRSALVPAGDPVAALQRLAATMIRDGHAYLWPAPADEAELTALLAAMAGREAPEIPAAPPVAENRRELVMERDRLARELAEARAKHQWYETMLLGREAELKRVRRINTMLLATLPGKAAKASYGSLRKARQALRRRLS